MATGATVRTQVLWEEQRAARRLGVVMDPPKAIYFIYLPLLLTAVALLAWTFPTDSMLLVTSILGGVIGSYALLDLLINQAAFRVTNFLGTMLLVSYGLGTANSWFTIDRAGIPLAEFFNRDPVAVTRGLAVVLGSAALLYGVGELLEKPVLGRDYIIDVEDRSYLFIAVGTAIIAIAYLTGHFNYGGITNDASDRSNPIDALLAWITTPLFAYTAFVFYNTTKRPQKLFVLGCGLLQLVLLIPLGRRYLAFTILTGVFALRMGRRSFKLGLARRVILVAVLAGLVSFTSIVFYYLRSVNVGHDQTISFAERVQLAMELRETRNSSEVLSVLQENVERRTFILGYLSDLLDATQKQKPIFGRDLVLEVKRVIPSSVWSNKSEVLGVVEEALADQYLGFAYTDEANSVLTAGALDFGILGALLYPLLLCFFLRVYLEVVGNAVPKFVSLLLILATVGMLFEVENELNAYFITVRNGILFAVILGVAASVPRFQWRRT